MAARIRDYKDMSTLQDLFNKAKGVQETSLWELCAAAGYTADRRYRPGEISEKTGLQKQPDGSWRNPKGERNYNALITSEKVLNHKGDSLSPDFEDYPEIKNTVDAENHIKNSGYFSNEANIDLNGVDVTSAKSIIFVLDSVFSAFPKFKGFLSGLGPQEMDPKYAASYTPSKKRINLNLKYYKNYKEIQYERFRNLQTKFNPAGTTAKDFITHEIGHAINHFLAIKKGMSFEDYSVYITSKALKEAIKTGALTIPEGLSPTEKNDFLVKYVKDSVSEQASVDNGEFLAEAFSEYFSSKEPRLMARLIGEQIKQELS